MARSALMCSTTVAVQSTSGVSAMTLLLCLPCSCHNSCHNSCHDSCRMPVMCCPGHECPASGASHGAVISVLPRPSGNQQRAGGAAAAAAATLPAAVAVNCWTGLEESMGRQVFPLCLQLVLLKLLLTASNSCIMCRTYVKSHAAPEVARPLVLSAWFTLLTCLQFFWLW